MARPHSGKWFEELTVGLIVQHALTRTVTETDNVLFTTLTLNPQPLHLDHEFAAATEFGRPLVNSFFTLGLVGGISVLETTHGTTVANLGMEETVFPAPVFVGDTIHVETEVVAARESKSRPDAGIVTVRTIGKNQKGDIVCSFDRTMLVQRHGHALEDKANY